ncbi:tubulin monoglutamylase TTLL4-like isoform X6 [Plodia interpunctella]|uniref:tubulin monoglutamylase TTLL4-like isoform X6 n=1 Tax=Plodia interpunctella TaxID=58824 RepID=UPI002368C0FC|nr:tubulin monoglutamylase TTLL4-like isoform X6 [Plodia interpunctella]
MWTYDDAPRIGVSDMDSRGACPSFEAGFDVCDPLGSVLEWAGRGPARVLRRRCRSEGIDRSPYEDATLEPHRSADGIPRQRVLPNKSQFTLNNIAESRSNRFRHECSLPAAQNGDYIMAHELNRHHGYQPGRSKFVRTSPTRPLLVTTLSNTKVDDSRLPKVEELLEKVDHEMMEVQVAKQPLKSILNNPLPKSPPQGILKKPKSKPHHDSKVSIEGRRRQRASSESDNLYCSFHVGSPIPGYDNRLTYLSGNMKRAKDNSGTGYSYGTAIASLSSPPRSRTNAQNEAKNARCTFKESVVIARDDFHNGHVLRTTVINGEAVGDFPHSEIQPRQETPTPTCPAVSPALPVSSVTAIPVKKIVKTAKKKVKVKAKVSKIKTNCKLDNCVVETEAEDAHSRSPSPDHTESWTMETDPVSPDIDKTEKPPPAPKKDEVVEKSSANGLTNKTNGVVAPPPKKVISKDQMFMTALHTTNPFKLIPSRKESPLCIPDSITSCLRQSLFPRVPPYLRFVAHDEGSALKIPAPIQKHLKWKLTTITPIIVKKTLNNSGFRLVKSECDTAECPQEETVEWIGIWGKHMKSLMFRAIKDGQKMNHFPGTFQIGRKDRLWRNLQKLASKYGVNEFGIMPKTYVLPHDMKLLKHDWEKHAANNEKWIIKPPASARGTGIKVVSRWTQIPKKRAVVVQRYVAKPFLINGNKFDMRLYVLVTSVHPLRIYLYKDGLARFASVKYNDEVTSLNDRYMHLTNYSINRLSKNYTPNEDFAACEGHKWTLQTLFQYLKTEKNIDTDALWESLKDLVIKTIISGEASISSLTKANITSRYNCYELFGIDVLLDEDLKPWLLEVNISPSLHSASPLDIHVKGPLVSTVLNIAQFQVPLRTNLEMLSKDKPNKLGGLPYDCRLYTIYLSKEERDKHIIYTNMEDRDLYLRDILSTLTPDDVRHLIQAEDELTQTGQMERVFPTQHTHRYLRFLAGPRYYNRLFDAWECRYHNHRDPGLTLLRNLCDIGYHLEVPPVPLKNDVDAPSPPASERPSVPSVCSLEPQAESPAPPPAPPSAPPLAPPPAPPRPCGDAHRLAGAAAAPEPRA